MRVGGQSLQFPAALPDQVLQRPRLGLEQVLVIGHHDRTLDSVDVALNAHAAVGSASSAGGVASRSGLWVGTGEPIA